jgi:hypothetical protein
VTDLMGAAAGQGAAAGRALGLPLFSPAQLLAVLGVDAAAPSVATATAPVPIVTVHPMKRSLCAWIYLLQEQKSQHVILANIYSFSLHERGQKYRGRRS